MGITLFIVSVKYKASLKFSWP